MKHARYNLVKVVIWQTKTKISKSKFDLAFHLSQKIFHDSFASPTVAKLLMDLSANVPRIQRGYFHVEFRRALRGFDGHFGQTGVKMIAQTMFFRRCWKTRTVQIGLSFDVQNIYNLFSCVRICNGNLKIETFRQLLNSCNILPIFSVDWSFSRHVAKKRKTNKKKYFVFWYMKLKKMKNFIWNHYFLKSVYFNPFKNALILI